MAELEQDLKKALEEIRNSAKSKERKFTQTVDLIINLQKYDLKKNPINIIVNLPHKSKEKKIAGFFETKSSFVDTITSDQFKKYSDKKKLKTLVKKYDFFIAQAKLMPKVATTFGRVLGPAGKMPSPQLGIILNADEKSIADLKQKINTSVKIRAKEASIKVAVGKEKMKDEEVIENVMAIYSELIKVLPRDKENIKNIEVKFTMSKPSKIRIR
jgi:large subunit ribosomal protein L1